MRMGALVLLGALAACGGRSEPARPNVVLIVIDTLRADSIADPEGRIATPHIDALAADGVAFAQAFTHAPMTLPAHTSLFSSRAPFETGVLNNKQQVPAELPLLAEWMSSAGYATRAVASLGTLRHRKGGGLERGFDAYDVDFPFMRRAEEVQERLEPELDRLAALSTVQPFFLFTHYCDPHSPYNAHGTVEHEARIALDGAERDVVTTSDMTFWTDSVTLAPGAHALSVRSNDPFLIRWMNAKRNGKRIDLTARGFERLDPVTEAHIDFTNDADTAATFDLELFLSDEIDQGEARRRYSHEVQHVDAFVGHLLDGLKQRGLYDDALVILTSDHGESLGERNHVGHVQSLYDVLLHVPLIVKLPAGDARVEHLRRLQTDVVRHVDLVPTILEAIDLRALPGQTGLSLLSDTSPRVVVAETHKPESRRNLLCLRDDTFKLIFEPDAERFALFDLVADPDETKDLYATRANERADWPELLRQLAHRAQASSAEGLEIDEETRLKLDALGYAGDDGADEKH